MRAGRSSSRRPSSARASRPSARRPPGGAARAPARPRRGRAPGCARVCRRSALPASRPPTPPAPCGGCAPSECPCRPRAPPPAQDRPLHWPAVMADGKRPILDVEDRPERGTRAAKRLRREGYVPGVVYGGKDGDSTSFKVSWRDLRQVLAGSALIDLKVGGKTRPVIVKDQHQHPVRDELLHIDLLEVRLDEKIQTQVNVHLEGAEEAPGIKEGGVLEHVTHQLNIEALPTDIPEAIVVDVSGLEIAATMHLSEISAPSGVTFLDDPEETIIATVVVPTEVEEPEIEEETELVGEDGEPLEEGAEPAEGEGAEPAEGEAAPAEEAEGSE